MPSELNRLTIKEAHEGLKKKDFSAEELVKDCLNQIKKVESKVSAFLSVFQEEALAQAKEIDRQIAQDLEIKPLTGIPLAIKDNILIQGFPCTAGSKILANYQAPYDATVIKKLKNEKCIILGKTNLDEFACGSSTENSAFGPTRNPKALNFVPGGSSGGSAAAVAAYEVLGSLGSDTGGSIRQPASLCGIVGLKPTYGSVSRYGLIAMASSLDVIGPMARSVEDAEIIYEAICGYDELDSTTFPKIKFLEPKVNSLADLKKIKIGLPREYFVKGLDTETEKVIFQAIDSLKESGAIFEEVSLPNTEYALPVYYILMSSELSSNLARYDGIRYGLSLPTEEKFEDIYDFFAKVRSQGFGEEIKRRIMLGTFALSEGYREAFYQKAQSLRRMIIDDFLGAFSQVDYLLTPTSPTPAWPLGEKITDPLQMYLSDIFTISANLAGIPALSLPCGEVQGLPVGLQLLSSHFGEKQLFALGKICEKIFSKN